MSNNAETIARLVHGVTVEQGRWKPDPESWSILEVINHLYDEEREDFRTRLDFILHDRDGNPPPIDPVGWVTARRYNERDLAESLNHWLAERQQSLDWLRGLASPDWEAAYDAPFGRIAAGDMLAAWLAHDFLHMRQLVELHYAYHARQTQPYAVNYAGPW
jgi:hypothetical protein